VRSIRAAVYIASIAVLCIGVAQAASAQVSAGAAISSANRLEVNVNARLNSAVFSVQSDPTATVSVGIGTDAGNLIYKTDSAKQAVRNVTISPLAPDTKYFCRIKSVSKNGAVATKTCQFNTDPILNPVMAVTGNGITLNGVRTYLIMAQAFNECPSRQVVAGDVAAGVKYFYHKSWYGCPDENHSGRWLTADELDGLLGGQVGWIQDGPRRGYSPPTLPPLPPWDNLPELINLQGSFRFDDSSSVLYSCGEQWSSGEKIFRQLRNEAASGNVIYQFPLTTTIGKTNRTCTSAARMAAVFWIPVLANADGIYYQTQHYALPSDGVDVDPSVQRAAALQARKLAAIYPCLFGGKAVAASSDNDAVKVMAKSWAGGTCVVALNTGDKSGNARVKAGSMSRSSRVFWEGRNASFSQGAATDRFDPYELHVYYVPGT
jgi:hypothetical protein